MDALDPSSSGEDWSGPGSLTNGDEFGCRPDGEVERWTKSVPCCRVLDITARMTARSKDWDSREYGAVWCEIKNRTRRKKIDDQLLVHRPPRNNNSTKKKDQQHQ